jgi:hypothetical protein
MELEFNEKQKQNNCFLFSYDIIKYNHYHSIIKHKYSNNDKYLTNIVLKNYTFDFPIEIHNPYFVILDTNMNLKIYDNFKRYIKIDFYDSPDIKNIIIHNRDNCNHSLKLIDNMWKCNMTDYCSEVDYILVEFNENPKIEFIKCNSLCFNLLKTVCDMNGLLISCWDI